MLKKWDDRIVSISRIDLRSRIEYENSMVNVLALLAFLKSNKERFG